MASLVNHSVTNLINGVSQQASSVRLDNQLEEQVNCVSDVTNGLTIRNGVELVNKTELDISNTVPINFTVDDVPYATFLNTSTDSVALTHIPLSTDVEALATSIDSPAYLDGAGINDIKIVEDKDKIYIVNKNQKVGAANSYYTYRDVKIYNTTTNVPDSKWTTGSYRLTIDSVVDTESSASSSEPTFTLDVTASMTPANIADAINASSIVNEIGPVEASGDRGSYRLTFTELPTNFLGPEVTVTELTAISYSGTESSRSPLTGDRYDDSTYYFTNVIATNNNPDYTKAAFGSSVEHYVNRATDSIRIDSSTILYRGTQRDIQYEYYPFIVSDPSITPLSLKKTTIKYGVYSISTEQVSYDYVPTVSSAAIVSAEIDPKDRYADQAMVWITGVSSDQEYSVYIEYEDANGNAQTTLGPYTATVDPNDLSQININWVADYLRNQINNSTHFSALASEMHSNAFMIKSTISGAYRITNVIVDNSFDNTSISSVVRATVNNSSSVPDPSTLPSVFNSGFKVRVAVEENSSSNYYLQFDSSFNGWREVGLDSSRRLDPLTLPYVIDKDEVRTRQEINIRPATWSSVLSGDYDSNPDPTFFNRKINDIFFYGSRLGFATDDSLTLSAIDDTSNFYRTTTSSVLSSDRVSIKLDSSKIGFSSIRSVVIYGGKLLINTGDTQSELLVDSSFNLTTARLAQVSSYSLGESEPLPVNDSLYFAVSHEFNTQVYGYTSVGNNLYVAEDITKHIPTYIEGSPIRMDYANDSVILSTDNDLKVLYVQNRYSNRDGMLQNAWHKWELPFEVKYFKFFNNILYIFMNTENSEGTSYTLISKVTLKPQSVAALSTDEPKINWTPYLDCFTKDKSLIEDLVGFVGMSTDSGVRYLDTVENGVTIPSIDVAYNSSLVEQVNLGTVEGPFYSEVSPKYSWKKEGNLNIIYLNDEEIIRGNASLSYVDYGNVRITLGEDESIYTTPLTSESYYTDNRIYGIPFTSKITLSKIIPRQQASDGSYSALNFSTLMLRRMRLDLGNSGTFKVSVAFEDRKDYDIIYNGQPLGNILLGRASVSDINFKFPINGKSDKVVITITSDSSTPFNLLSYEWQGRLTQRGRNI